MNIYANEQLKMDCLQQIITAPGMSLGKPGVSFIVKNPPQLVKQKSPATDISAQ